MLKKCSACNGSRTILGLGCIEHTCKVCNGVGYQNPDDEKPEPLLKAKEADISIETRKKRGRKTKYNIKALYEPIA